MADLTPDTDDDTGGHVPTGMPRWVKVFVIVGILLVVLVAIGLITGRAGQHGPGRHMRHGLGDRLRPAVFA